MVEGGVVALAHQGVHGPEHHPLGLTAGEHVLHHGVVDQAHIEGVGEGDGGLQGAQLLELQEPRRLAEAVEGADAGGELMGKGVLGAGQDHGDPGLVRGGVHRGVTHQYAGHVGDLVPGAPGQRTHPDAEVLCAHLEHENASVLCR